MTTNIKTIYVTGDVDLVIEPSEAGEPRIVIERPRVMLPLGNILIGVMRPHIIHHFVSALPIEIQIEPYTVYHGQSRRLREIGDTQGTQCIAYKTLEAAIKHNALEWRKELHPDFMDYLHVTMTYTDIGCEIFESFTTDPIEKHSIWATLNVEHGVCFDDYIWSSNALEKEMRIAAAEEGLETFEGYVCFVRATVDDITYINISHSWSGHPGVLDHLPNEIHDAQLDGVIPGSVYLAKALQRNFHGAKILDNWYKLTPALDALIWLECISPPNNN